MSRRPSPLAAALKSPEREVAQTPPTPEQPAEAQAAAARSASDEIRHAEPRRPNATQESNASYVAPSRARKASRTHYLPPEYWDTLAEISFRNRDTNGKRIPQERLVAEALNLLFLKYNYPPVRE